MKHDEHADKPSTVQQKIQFAEVQMMQAQLAQGPARMAMIIEAKDALIAAEKLEKGSGAWNLACLSAHSGSEDLCRKWLERAKRASTLPQASEIQANPYLQPVTAKKWFRQFLDSLD